MNPKNTPCRNKHSARKPAAFRAGESLQLDAASGAKADGQNINKVTATLTRGTEYVSNEIITLSVVSGSARFTNGEKTYTGTTSTLGVVNTALTDTVAETVDILASYAPASETVTATSTFVATDLNLLAPVIEGVNNSNLWIADLEETVMIDIFHWSSIADGDIVVLTLSGEDASGLSVEDVTEQHTVGPADLEQQKLVFPIGKDRIRPFGAHGHPGETGSLVLRYTVNGTPSKENVFTVHGDDGGTGTTYTVTADIVVNNADANGTDSNVVTWSAVDENGGQVTNLSGTAAVDGSAGINNTGSNTLRVTSMPVTLSYQDLQAETVTASLILDDNAGSGEARLTFAESVPDLGCRTESVSPSVRSLISLLGDWQFVARQRYRVTITRPDGRHFSANKCFEGFEFDDSVSDCAVITDDFIPVSVENNANSTFVATFESPVSGVLAKYHTAWSFIFNVQNSGAVQICVETA